MYQVLQTLKLLGDASQAPYDYIETSPNACNPSDILDTIVSCEVVHVDSYLLSFQLRIRVFRNINKVNYVTSEGRHNR